jgi:hypothetical protein
MNPLAWLNPGRWMLYAAFAAALALGAWRVHHVIDQGGYDRAVAEYTAAALKAQQAADARHAAQEAQARAASANYQAAAAAAAAKIKTVQKDLNAATQNLAACRLDSRAVQLLNSAANDSP